MVHLPPRKALFAFTFAGLGGDFRGGHCIYRKGEDRRREGRTHFSLFLDRVAKQREKAVSGKVEHHCV